MSITGQLGVEILVILEKSVSTTEKSATTLKFFVTTNVESTPMLERILIAPLSFNFKRRATKKSMILEKELERVPNNSVISTERSPTERTNNDDPAVEENPNDNTDNPKGNVNDTSMTERRSKHLSDER